MVHVMVLSVKKNWIERQNMDIIVYIVAQKPSVHLSVSVVCLVEPHLPPNLSSPSYLLLDLTLCRVSNLISVHPSTIPSTMH